jgi:hypothetical protein
MTEMLTREEFEKVKGILHKVNGVGDTLVALSYIIAVLEKNTEPELVVCPVCGWEVDLYEYAPGAWGATCRNKDCLYPHTNVYHKDELIRKLEEAKHD